jgi:excisionase family DNA binding protein
MDSQNDMVNGKEICILLGIGRRTLTRLARARLLPGLVRVGRRLKMHRAVLEAYRRGEASATALRQRSKKTVPHYPS